MRVQRHRFDPISGALGVIAVVLGALVVSGQLAGVGGESGWWIAVAAVIIGLAIIPWRRRGEAPDR